MPPAGQDTAVGPSSVSFLRTKMTNSPTDIPFVIEAMVKVTAGNLLEPNALKMPACERWISRGVVLKRRLSSSHRRSLFQAASSLTFPPF